MTTTRLEAPSTPVHSPVGRAPIEHLAIICSKGTLDMAYPGLILANAARMSGIDATLFFTFWGLDIITKKTVDHLHVPTVGNPSMHIPTMVGGLPGMESLATTMMQKQMEKPDIPLGSRPPTPKKAGETMPAGPSRTTRRRVTAARSSSPVTSRFRRRPDCSHRRAP